MKQRLATRSGRAWGFGYAAGLAAAVGGLTILFSGCQAPQPQARPYQYYATRIRPADSLPRQSHSTYVVFEVSYQYGDSIIADGGVSETLTFTADGRAPAFRLQNAALRASGAVYEKRCLCREEGANRPIPVGQGYVSGIRLAPGTWRLDVQVRGLNLVDTVRLGRRNLLNLNTPHPLTPGLYWARP